MIEGKHPKLVSEKDWLKVNDLMTNNHRLQTKNTNLEYIPLKVFMKCEKTGDPLTGYLVKKKGIWYYKSRSKGTKLNVNANKLNNTFAKHLKNYELRDGLEKPFKQLVTYAFSKYHSNKHFDLKQLSAQKKKVEDQLEKLEERFAIGEIGQDIYQNTLKNLVMS